jgi:hypothetical protein
MNSGRSIFLASIAVTVVTVTICVTQQETEVKLGVLGGLGLLLILWAQMAILFTNGD